MAQAVAQFDHWAPASRYRKPLLSRLDFAHGADRNAPTPLVVVIENDSSSRSMLVDVLKSSGFAVMAFATGDEMLDAELGDQPGCFILDAQLPGLSGLDLHHQLKMRGLNQPAIFLSGHGDIALSVRAMKAGAVDFLLKPVSDENLLEGVTCAIALDRRRRNAAQQLRKQTERVASLTPRELQVMQGVAHGQLNKQIAYDLGISEITVKAHRGNVMRKLCARSVCDLVRTWDMLPPQIPIKADSGCQILSIV